MLCQLQPGSAVLLALSTLPLSGLHEVGLVCEGGGGERGRGRRKEERERGKSCLAVHEINSTGDCICK